MERAPSFVHFFVISPLSFTDFALDSLSLQILQWTHWSFFFGCFWRKSWLACRFAVGVRQETKTKCCSIGGDKTAMFAQPSVHRRDGEPMHRSVLSKFCSLDRPRSFFRPSRGDQARVSGAKISFISHKRSFDTGPAVFQSRQILPPCRRSRR